MIDSDHLSGTETGLGQYVGTGTGQRQGEETGRSWGELLWPGEETELGVDWETVMVGRVTNKTILTGNDTYRTMCQPYT